MRVRTFNPATGQIGIADTAAGPMRFECRLVYGPPCGGKSSYVANNLKPGEIVIEFDRLHRAITGGQPHEHNEAAVSFTLAARDAVVRRIRRSDFDGVVWVVAGAPRRSDREYWRAMLGAEPVLIDESREVCIERAERERPAAWQGFVEQWFERFEPDE